MAETILLFAAISIIASIVLSQSVTLSFWFYEDIIYQIFVWIRHQFNRRDVLRNPDCNDLSATIIRAQERHRGVHRYINKAPLMARPQAFERELRLATAGLAPDAIAPLLAQFAREQLAEAQRNGEAPLSFERYVNGRAGVSEDAVIPPGPIVYEFSWLQEIAEYALAFAEARSPVLSGRYKASWFALVNGSRVTDFSSIPSDAELIITNDQPYARKVDVGAMKMRVPPGIIEDMRQAVMRRFGNVITAERRFINLEGGYILKGQGGKRGRRAARAGAEMTYPALVVRMRFN